MPGTEPLFLLKSLGGNCAAGDLLANITNSSMSFQLINPPSSWLESHGPNAGQALGTSGPFVVTLDKGQGVGLEEKVLCSSISGTTVTVYQQGSGPTLWTGRGFDGTTAVNHNAPTNPSGLVVPGWSAADAYETNLLVHKILGALGPTGYNLTSTGTTIAWTPVSTLTPTAQTGNYSAVANDFVEMSGPNTITLPAPANQTTIGATSVNGSGANPCIIATSTGSILGPGIAPSSTQIKLGMPGAQVTLLADGNNWNIVAGARDTGWINAVQGVDLPSSAFGNTGGGNPVIAYRLKANEVELRGMGVGTLSWIGGQALAMPVGFRPTTTKYGVIWMAGGPTVFEIQANGVGTLANTGTNNVNFDFVKWTVD